ncbi:hypothetical protein AB0L99_25140 [Streptomyces sp. NPDC051954]
MSRGSVWVLCGRHRVGPPCIDHFTGHKEQKHTATDRRLCT